MNKKVMAMFEKAEDEYNDLMSRKNIIEVNFQIIEMFFALSVVMLICSLISFFPLLKYTNAYHPFLE